MCFLKVGSWDFSLMRGGVVETHMRIMEVRPCVWRFVQKNKNAPALLDFD
jgi:hypothetical protein